MIYRTRVVTYPRSGHHWLVKMLTHALGSELHYVDIYETHKNLESNPEINLEKTHDFNNDTPTSGFKIIVQIREFLPAVTSYWKLQPNWQTDAVACKKFIRWQRGVYAKFVNRWVVGYVENRLTIHYEDLCSKTVNVVTDALAHITDMEFDRARALAEFAVAKEPRR